MEEKKRIIILIIIKVLLIITIAMIWGQSMIKRDVSQMESDALLKIINPFNFIEIGDVSSAAYWLMSDVIRKLAHITEYTILGSELMAHWILQKKKSIDKMHFIILIFSGFIVGLIDETIQMFSSRGSLVTDVWIDSIGVILGLVIFRKIGNKYFSHYINDDPKGND